mgnify:CR=1 FL=1
MSRRKYVVCFDKQDEFRLKNEKDDIDMPRLIEENENLKNEIYFLKEENSKLKEELQAFYGMTLKDTSIRGTVWYLDEYEEEAIVVQTKLDSYMLIDKETYNRWCDEEFTREEIIGELVKKGWRIKK